MVQNVKIQKKEKKEKRKSKSDGILKSHYLEMMMNIDEKQKQFSLSG